MPADVLALTSEAYGLSPAATATALGDTGAPPGVVVPVLLQRCDGDQQLTIQVARSILQFRTDTVLDALADHDHLDLADVTDLRTTKPLSRDRDALIAAHTPPRRLSVGERGSSALLLLDALPQAAQPAGAGAAANPIDWLPSPEARNGIEDTDALALLPDALVPGPAAEGSDRDHELHRIESR